MLNLTEGKGWIETTIPSYLVARPSRDLLIAARQQITRDRWDSRGAQFDPYISEPVLEEAPIVRFCQGGGWKRWRTFPFSR